MEAALKHHAEGQIDDAVDAYHAALQTTLNSGTVHNNLGLIFALHGHADKAITEYQKAITAEPYKPYAYNNLGTTLAEIGRYEEAVPLIKRLSNVMPPMPTLTSTLALYSMIWGVMKKQQRLTASLFFSILKTPKLTIILSLC